MAEQKWIGLIDGMMEGNSNCTFEELLEIKNDIPKEFILEHMKGTPIEMAIPAIMLDVQTREAIGNGCVHIDGKFAIPAAFVYHYEKYDIGIPKEYEEYLSKTLNAQESHTF